MTHIGFAAQKLPGSSWVFELEKDGESKKIMFHEPHPDSKIPSQWARRIARRLNRHFGWTAETFVKNTGC